MQLLICAVQSIKANQEACIRLARRCAKIITDLDMQMTGRWADAPAALIKNLEKFLEYVLALLPRLARRTQNIS